MVERTVGGGAGRDDPACGSAGHGGECKEKGWEMLRIQCFEKNVKKKKNISVFLNLFSETESLNR